MNIEGKSLHFDNLLVYETLQLRENWQEGIFLMEDFTLLEDIYKNGPIFFSVTSEPNEKRYGNFTYYLPINEPVRLDDVVDFRFEKSLHIDNCLVMRQADQEVDFHAACQKIKDYAANNNIPLEDTFYCMLLEVYDDIIIDLYVPIKDRGDIS